jgi:hypothetical protein
MPIPTRLPIPDGIVINGGDEETRETGDSEMSADEDEDVVVAFCGSVMEKYHAFRIRCQTILDELVSQPVEMQVKKSLSPGSKREPPRLRKMVEQRRVVLEGNSDGGILGAGILAAVVDNKELSSSVASIAAK